MNSMELSTSVVEYKVHGCFSSRAEARSFPDTFFFTARELKDAGLPKARIREAISAHHSALLERGMEDLDHVSSDEEEPEEEEPAAAAMQQDGTDLEPGGAAASQMLAPVANDVVENAVVEA